MWSPDGKTLYARPRTARPSIELLALDADTGARARSRAGSFYGFDISPDGKKIVYSRAPEATDQGICGDQFDLYVTNPTAARKSASPTTASAPSPSGARVRDRLLALPLGPVARGLLVARDLDDRPRRRRGPPVIARSPASIVLLGLYGLQPIGWLDESAPPVGLRSEYGTKAAVLDTETRRMRQFNELRRADLERRPLLRRQRRRQTALRSIIRRVDDGQRMLRRKNVVLPQTGIAS